MRSLFVCGLAAVLLASSNAYAQTEAVKAQALARYQEGVALHEKGQEEEAYLRFAQAYAVVQTPPILFNLARTEQLTGRRMASSAHFRAYIAGPEHPRVTKELRAKAQGFINDMNAQLGHITLEVPPGSTVSVDGKDVVAVGVVDVDPGVHTVAARAGEQKGSVQVTTGAGVTANAKIVFDGAAGVAPVVVAPVVSPVAIPVSPPIEPPVTPGPEPYWNGRRTGGVIIAGAGVVVMVIGGVFGAERGSDTSSASAAAAKVGAGNTGCSGAGASSASCTSLASALSSNVTDARLEEQLLLGGGVLVAIGVVTTFWPSPTPKSTAGFVPTLGPHMAGLQWSGSF
jgi:hypothetical protein